MTREACACGGEIVVARTDWEVVWVAVYRHTRTPLHRRWREGRA